MSVSLSAHRSFIGLLGANTILGAAMPMLIILGGLAGLALAPTAALATLPPSVQILAGLLSAGPFSWFMGRYGRNAGFVLGGVFALAGSAVCAWALVESDFVLLCLGHMALGAALACYQYFRFAAAEVVSESWQPVAISLMLSSGLVAALVGPQVFIASRDAMAGVPLAGAYVSLAALTLVGLLPLLVVRFPAPATTTGDAAARGSAMAVLRRRPVLAAVTIGAISQGVMVLLMTSTPLAMVGQGFDEDTAGDVVRWHVVAMFAPSFFTGFLIRRFGARLVVGSGLALLAAAALVGAADLAIHHFYGALILLGLGWNFGFIGATSVLAASASADERSLVQGVNDTLIALASTLCAFAGGAIVAGYGWLTLSLAALPVLAVGLVAAMALGRNDG